MLHTHEEPHRVVIRMARPDDDPSQPYLIDLSVRCCCCTLSCCIVMSPPRAHLSAACVRFLFSAPGRDGAARSALFFGSDGRGPAAKFNKRPKAIGRRIRIACSCPRHERATTIKIEQQQLQRSDDSRAAASDRQRSGGQRTAPLSAEQQRSQHSVETEGGRNEEKLKADRERQENEGRKRTIHGRHTQSAHNDQRTATRRALCTGHGPCARRSIDQR